MWLWIRELRCPNQECQAFVSGQFCKFCGTRLPPTAKFSRALSLFKNPFRTVLTFATTAFAPWRIGSYLSQSKKGVISSPTEISLWAAGFYVASFFIVLPDSQEEKTWVSVLLYIGLACTFGYLSVVFHGLMRSLGSTKNLLATFAAGAYSVSLVFLVFAVLVRLKLGIAYATLAFTNPADIPQWQKAIDAIWGIWVVVINVIIQSKVHSIQWYKVAGSVLFMWPFIVGWYAFLIYMFLNVLP
jgi:hypothetical protein